MSRYYVHTASTAPAALQHTFVYKPDSDAATVQQLVDAFVVDYSAAKQQHVALDQTDDAITNAAGDRLIASEAVNKRLEDRDDVFLAVHPAQPPPAPSAAASTSLAAIKEKAAAKPVPKRQHTEDERELFTVLEHGVKHHSDNKLNHALTFYDHLIQSATATQSPHDDIRTLRRTALSQSAAIHYNCQRYTEARDRLNRAVGLLSLSYRLPPAEGGKGEKQRDEERLEEAELFAMLARCHLHLKDWEEGELASSTAIERLAALKGKTKAAERSIARKRHDYQVLQVRIMYECGDERKKRDALALIEKLIASDDQHVPSLTYYAQIAVDSGNGVAVIPYLLRAVVNLQQQKGKDVDSEVSAHTHSLFARMVSLPTGLTTLLDALGHAAKMSSSLCFLAQVLKDHSAVAAAIGLYRRALELTRPIGEAEERVSVWLSLVHALEVQMEYEQAWQELRQWLQEERAREVAGVPLERVWEVVKGISTLAYDESMLTGTASNCPPWKTIPPLFDEGEIQVAIPTAASLPPAAPSASMVPTHKHIPAALTSAIKPHPLYSPATLNRLAMLFTMAKVLFVNGFLQPIPALVTMLEPTREHKELHLTLIRNEHAYYSTVAQLCRTLPYPVPAVPRLQTIWVIGDSHCLSSAWSTVTVSSVRYLLRPVLVTGTKAWHLRDECTFYTHANYVAARASIPSTPPPAALIFCFGEIDCREGLLQAVDKAKYAAIERAIDTCAAVYIRQMGGLARAKGLRDGRLFVQPVMPILDVTRGVVLLFNKRLRAAVEGGAEGKAGAGRVKWLEMESDLVGADGKFNKRYSLDGTHCHPQYVQLIERELNKQW